MHIFMHNLELRSILKKNLCFIIICSLYLPFILIGTCISWKETHISCISHKIIEIELNVSYGEFYNKNCIIFMICLLMIDFQLKIRLLYKCRFLILVQLHVGTHF